ncbi:glutathione peroxidase [Candidatus Pelagibacter sp.]|nr:glutathione peroxidase [Candidatus Pelagibacter sp.]
MKKLVLISFVIIMFFFKNFASAKYDKVFYDFQIKSIYGELIDLKKYKDKVILLVNTASYCGFTKQYSGLQKLWEKYESQGLIVLGVPSDSFNQEKKSDNEVKEFCEVNFNINFPLTEITEVKGKKAHPIYIWAKENFGNSAIPKWNFHKILINKEGKVENTYSSLTKPMSNKIILEIEKIL